MNPATPEFVAFVGSWRFRLYLLRRLPSAFFSGLRVDALSPACCSVSVPLRWFSQNPFRSVYFACLAMAGELATGLLAMAHLHRLKPPVSMLVTRLEADFVKKATDVATFTCSEGEALRAAIAESMRTGEGRTVSVRSIGKNRAGEVVATFTFTWSFKPKATAPRVLSASESRTPSASDVAPAGAEAPTATPRPGGDGGWFVV